MGEYPLFNIEDLALPREAGSSKRQVRSQAQSVQI